MDCQISENLLVQMYVEADDLLIAYQNYLKAEGKIIGLPRRQPELTASEVITIIAAYQLSGYKNFEYYYHRMIKGKYASYFPDAPSYKRFLNFIGRSLDLMCLWVLYTTCQSQRTGLYFVDAKKLPVCHLRRERSHRVFDGIAQKGKTSTGWFYGLKIHLIINNLGEIIAFDLSAGNVADNNQELLKRMMQGLRGICVGDKGYLTKLFSFFYESGLHLLTKPRKNMKNLPVDAKHKLLIDKRGIIESVFDILSSVCDIDHTRHRSPINATVHILAALVGYHYIEKKPRVFFSNKRIQRACAA